MSNRRETIQEEAEDKTVASGILKRIHRAVIHGDTLSERDVNWQGVVKVNKEQIVLTAQGRELKLLPNQPVKIGCIVLQELVRRATQQGPESKRYDWDAETGKPRDPNPLTITIVEESLNPDYVETQTKRASEMVGVPKL